MHKLRILVVEVIGLGLLIAWLMWKYPELVDDIIPWIALLLAWHVTWEFILDTKVVRHRAAVLGKRVNRMLIWPLVFLLGGGISLLYWAGINKSLRRLASLAAQRASTKTTALVVVTPNLKENENSPGPGEATGMTDSVSTVDLTPSRCTS